METNQAVLDEDQANYITRQEALKDKKRKKLQKAGKTKKEIEAQELEQAAEKLEDAKDQPEVKEEQVKYKMGEDYDNQLNALRKVDYEFEQYLAKAKVKALNSNDLTTYQELEQKKMNKAAIKIYLYGDENKNKESIDFDELNKDYKGKDLGNSQYQDFWKDMDGNVQKRGSQSVKRSR